MNIKTFIKQIRHSKKQDHSLSGATIVQAKAHHVKSQAISKSAIKVLRKLHKAGYHAYLVGGCVRDLLLGREPKDFDIATDAAPEEIKQVFRHCYLIGRRFRIAHVRMKREIFEVTTFRGPLEDSEQERSEHGIVVDDNVYGSIETDACRRDFTVNALYYDVENETVIDFCGGLQDIEAKQLSIIGDAQERYREDPVRILRAVRFAATLGLSIHPNTKEPIAKCVALLLHVSPSRLYLETQKLLLSGYSEAGYHLLQENGLFALLFPMTVKAAQAASDDRHELFVIQALQNTDRRIADDKPVTPVFLLAVFLWQPYEFEVTSLCQQEMPLAKARARAADKCIASLTTLFNIPKRHLIRMRDIWRLQPMLEKRKPQTCFRLLENPRFRAAYDFLLLRVHADDALSEVAQWWTDIQEQDNQGRAEMIEALPRPRKGGRKRKRK